MDIEDILTLADQQIFHHTGKHLDDLQKAILLGTLQGEKYAKIAEECQCTEGYVKDVASQLWKVLSEALGEEIKKSNFRSTLERLSYSNFLNFFGDNYIQQTNSLSLCQDSLKDYPFTENRKSESNRYPKKTQVDLTESPELLPFFGRTDELNTLENWILEERCRVVTLLGISGMGKTALATQLVKKIQDQFDYVIWQNLYSSLSLDELIANLLQFLSKQTDQISSNSFNNQLSQLMKYLREFRCLIILDDIQTILQPGTFSEYKPECENYGLFFKRIGTLKHQSCIILNSWEPPREIIELTGENSGVRCFYLQGLKIDNAKKILKLENLQDEKTWETLIRHYCSHPSSLKSSAKMIRDLFSGKVAAFLNCKTLFLGKEILNRLNQQFERLSELEQKITVILTNEDQPLTFTQILQIVEIAPSELLNVLQSLRQRSLIEKIPEPETRFTVQPILKLYLKLLKSSGSEISTSQSNSHSKPSESNSIQLS